MLSLDVEKRVNSEKIAKLKKDGKIPAVFYGRKEKSTPISIKLADFKKIWRQVGESSIFSIKCAGEEDKEVLVQEVDIEPLTRVPRHVDFYAIEKGKKLKIKVPLEFINVSPAVKDLGGTLVKVMHEVEIEALPKDLPRSLAIDISALVDFKSQILAKQIILPVGVTLVANSEEVVTAVSEPKIEEEKPAETIDLSSIEVEKKGKEVKEGEEVAGEAEAKPSSDKKDKK